MVRAPAALAGAGAGRDAAAPRRAPRPARAPAAGPALAWVLAWALAWALAWLALVCTFALPSQAQAQTACAPPDLEGRTQVWTAVLTVGSGTAIGAASSGYYPFRSFGGSLSDATFGIGENDYTINFVYVPGPGTLYEENLALGLDAAPVAAERAGLVFHVCDRSFALKDADSSGGRTNLWYDTGLDWSEASTRTLYLSVANANAAFADATATRSVAENTAAGAAIGARFAATDSEGDRLVYTLGGDDVGSFTVDSASGQLRTAAALDFERRGSYSVTVEVSDGTDLSGNPDTAVDDTVEVTVEVTNADEAGRVALSSGRPQAGTALTATLSDPDGATAGVTWQWSWASTATGSFTAIAGATSASYTPAAADAGRYLKATARYTDPEGGGKTAAATGANAVLAVAACAAPDLAGRTGVWSATLTRGAATPVAGTTVSGYLASRGLTAGSLDDTTFSVGTNNYTIDEIVAIDPGSTGAGTLSFSLTAALAAADRADLVLHACGHAFELGDAAYSGTYFSYSWTMSGLDWSGVTTRALRLSVGTANSAAAGAPSITGTATVGQALSASTSGITDANGKSKAEAGDAGHAWAWRWFRVGSGNAETEISGATGSSYVLQAADAGYRIRVKVTFTDDAGHDEAPAASAASAVVAAPTLSVADASAGEGDGSATFTVTLSALSNRDVVVSWAASSEAGDTAAAGEDFTAAAGRATVRAGETVATFSVPILQDNRDEADAETFTVTLGGVSPAGAATVATASARGSIADDDPPPVLSLEIDRTEIAEDGGTATVTVSTGSGSTYAADRTIALEFGGTAAPSDYRIARSLTLAAGAATVTATLTGVDDELDEDAETIEISGTVGGAGFGSTRTVAIADDDDPPEAGIAAAAGEEGSAIAFTVTLDAPSGRALTVDWATSIGAGDTAAAADFTADSGQLTFAAGTRSATVAVDTVEDAADEADETFTVTLSAPVNVTLDVDATSAKGTILNDDPDPVATLALTPASIRESDDTGTPGNRHVSTVTATLDRASGAETEIVVSAAAVAPAVAADLALSANVTLTIPAGRTSSTGTVTLTAADNDTDAPDKTFTVSATASNALGIVDPQDRALTIADEDPAPKPTLVLEEPSILESDDTGRPGNQHETTVTATLSHPSSEPTTLTLTASDAFTASGGGRLTVPAGDLESTGSVTLTAVDNDTDAPDREVTVAARAENTQGVDQPDGATLTVRDEDPAPTVTLELLDDEIAEDGGSTTVKARLSHPSSAPTTVTVAADGTVARAAAFSLTGATLTIPAGDVESSSVATIAATDDDTDAPDQAVSVSGTAENAQGFAGHPDPLALTIVDDEAAPTVTLKLSSDPITEENGVAEVTAVLSHPSSEATAVEVSSEAVSPALPADFAQSGGALEIPAGELSSEGEVTLTAAPNFVDAPDKTVRVSGTAANGQGIAGDPAAVTLTIADDDVRGFDWTPATLSLPEQYADGEEAFTVALTSEPTADVRVRLRSPGLAKLGLYPGTAVGMFGFIDLDFTPDDWHVPQAVSVIPRPDANAVNDTLSIGHTATGGDYEGHTGDYRVTLIDKDKPAKKIGLSVAPDEVAESGGAVELTVTALLDGTVRATETAVEVTIAAGTGQAADYSVSGPASFTLTIAANKPSATRTVTLTPVDDDLAEGPETVTISGTTTAAVEGTTTALAVTPATLTVTDDDARGVEVSKRKLEFGQDGSATYTVVLLSQPTGPVTVTPSVTGDPDVSVSPPSLEFTAATWQVAQTVTVAAGADDDPLDDLATVTHTVEGADYERNAVTAAPVTVTVTDDDAREVLLSKTELRFDEGGSESYTVALATEPAGPVTVTPAVTGNPDVTATPERLTFTRATWNVAQTVSVGAAQDADGLEDRATVTHTVAGADYEENNIAGPDLAVRVNDVVTTESIGLSVSPDTVPEDGTPRTVRVTATLDGAARNVPTLVTVRVGAGTAEAADFLAQPAVLTVTIPANRLVGSGTFRLTGTRDARDEGTGETVTVSGTAPDLGVTPAQVTVEDDDGRGFTVSPLALTVQEEGSGSYTLRLDAEPAGPVTVAPEVTDNPDVTAMPATLTFTAQDWSVAQRVTVRAAMDPDGDGETATVLHRATGADYDGLSGGRVTVTVEDIDPPSRAVQLELEPEEVAEDGGTATVRVTARLDGAARSTATAVAVTVTGGTATPGTDFFAVTGFEIAIPANRTEAAGSFGFTPKNDDVDEGTGETVTVGGTAPGLEVRPATLSLTDDDLRGIEVAPDPLTVPENGAARYGVRLNSAPVGGGVTVRVTGMSGTDLTVTGPDNADLGAGGVLSFTAENWETEQLVTVAAGPDDDAADDMATLTHRASGADYGAAARQALAVTVLDADTAALVLSETALDVQEQGPAVELTLRLATAPVDPVTVTVTGHDGTDLRVSPASHRFTALDWNTDKAFRVSAVADPDSQDDEPVRLTLTPAGSAEYAALGAGAVDVTLTDDDAPGLKLSASKLDVPEGRSRSFTVRLNTKPSGDVEVRVEGMSGSDLTVTGPGNADLGAGGVLSFTADSWNAAQTVTVAAGPDDDAADDMATLTLRASGADYGPAPPAAVAVAVDDDETAALAVSARALTVQEQGPEVALTVRLASAPVDPVTVTVTGHDRTDLRVSPSSHRFTALDWNTDKAFRVSAVGDADSQDDEPVRLTLTPSGSDEYGADEAEAVSVTAEDDDVPGIRLSGTALDVFEHGAASYGVRLTAKPVGGGVTVRVTGMSGTDLTVTGPGNADLGAGGVLSFTADNWETEQRVTVAAAADADAADDMATLTHRASGADYGPAPRQALAVTVLDADTAALVLSETALDVQEQGPAVELTLRLATAPVDPVTVTVTGHDGTDLRVSPASHRFTALDWNTDKAFRVSAVADPDSQDDEPVRLTLTPAGSAEYAALGAGAVDVTPADDDVPGLKLSASKLDVPEGRSRSFTVRLNTKPSRDVEVRVEGMSGSDLTVTGPGNADLGAGGVLSFTETDWNAAQTVTVAAGPDDDAADDMATLTLRASGADYGAAPPAEVAVAVEDDETAALEVAGSPVTVQENAAAAAGFTVALATQPLASVTVRVTGHAGTDVRVSPEAATFTADDWDTPRTFEVRAGDDSDAQNETVTLALTPEGSAAYAALAAQEVRVSVQDDDVPGIRLSATALDVAEGGRARYRVKLTAQPTGDVVVRVTGMSGTDLTLLGFVGRAVETLSFTQENWDLDRIVDVVADVDADAADDVAVLTHRASGADYGSAPRQALAVTVLDVDTAALVLSETALDVQEQGPAVELKVRLASAPVSRVSVAVTGHSGTGVWVSPGSLSFGASDWRTPKSFRVTADGDADAVDEAAVTLSLAATGSAEYAALPASEVAVAVGDDDVPALRLSASAVAVPEGGSASYTLRLTEAPTADVTVQPAIVSGYGVTLTDRYGNRRFELVFTPSNWSVGQQLTLTTEDDDDAADGAAEVRHWVSIGSPEYPYGLHALLPVTVDDDETPALEVSKRSLRVPLSGAAETFGVSLATPPATGGAAVEVLLPDAAKAGFTVNPPWLSFNYDNWDSPQTVTVTAAFRAAVGDTGVLRLVPRHSPEYAALAPVELAMTVTAAAQAQAQLAAPSVTGVPSVSGPAADGAYAENERIEARVGFDAPVTVDTAGGTPTLGLALGGVRREASYESGSGTAELVFARTVTAGGAGAGAARAIASGLRLNGATVRGDGGTDAALGFGSAPGVTGVAVGEAPGGDGLWSPGEAASVTVTFAEPVAVDTAGGTPSIGVLLGGSVAKRAAYTGGTGTSALSFAYGLAAADSAVNAVLVPPNGLALDGGAIRSTAGLDAGLEHTGAGLAGLARRDPLPVLSVADARASEDGTLSFVVTLEPPASAPVTVAYATADGSATAGSDYTAASGTLGFKAGESGKTVTVALTPDGETEGSETLTLTLSAASGATIGDGEATGTVTDPAPPALTARFDKAPEEHDGSSAFDLELHFSAAPRGLSYRTLTGGSFFNVTNGTVTKAKRLVKKDNSGWRITVEPASDADVAIGLPPAPPAADCAEAAVVCTADGARLSAGAATTVPGPASLSVADAAVREGPNATLDFTVTLSRARHEATTVDYATSDGTATAGADYTADSGTLTFEAGETGKTVSVAVLDDDHDEGSETMTFTLSNPVPAATAKLGDATATGTIANTDPIPQAWIARFGRTVAD